MPAIDGDPEARRHKQDHDRFLQAAGRLARQRLPAQRPIEADDVAMEQPAEADMPGHRLQRLDADQCIAELGHELLGTLGLLAARPPRHAGEPAQHERHYRADREGHEREAPRDQRREADVDDRLEDNGDELGDGEVGFAGAARLAADGIGEAADRLPHEVCPPHLHQAVDQGQAQAGGDLGDRVGDISHCHQGQHGLQHHAGDDNEQQRGEVGGEADRADGADHRPRDVRAGSRPGGVDHRQDGQQGRQADALGDAGENQARQQGYLLSQRGRPEDPKIAEPRMLRRFGVERRHPRVRSSVSGFGMTAAPWKATSRAAWTFMARRTVSAKPSLVKLPAASRATMSLGLVGARLAAPAGSGVDSANDPPTPAQDARLRASRDHRLSRIESRAGCPGGAGPGDGP